MNRGMAVALVAGSLFSGPAAATAAEAPVDAAIEAAAKSYYARVREHEKREKAALDRGTEAMGDESFKPPAVATGLVRDRFDEPVPNAKIVVAKEASSDQALGEASTDATGRFRIPLKSNAYRGLTLTVTAKGFDRWACGGIYGGLVDYPVRLDRVVGDACFAAIRAEPDRSRRVSMLLDMVGTRQMGSPELPLLYPRLGALREDLLAIAQSASFAAKDDRGESPAERARRLLIFWFDPADEPLIRKWVAQSPGRLRLEDKSAATIEAVCAAYADWHFGHKKERTFNRFSEPLFGPDKDHALVEFEVRYADWGYSEYLVLLKQKDRWALKLVAEHMHMHFKRSR